MNWLFRLVFVIVQQCLEWGIKLSLDLVGCACRLLYWSVRTYGWRQVGSFCISLWVSLWVHYHFIHSDINLLRDWMAALRGARHPHVQPRTLRCLRAVRLALQPLATISDAMYSWLSFSNASLGSVAVSTAGLWAGMVGATRWLIHRWSLPIKAPCLSFQPFSPSLAIAPTATGKSDVRSPRALPLLQASSPESSSLWERVAHPTTLHDAWQRVLRRGGGPGLDKVTVEAFTLNAEQALQRLAIDLRTGAYGPSPPAGWKCRNAKVACGGWPCYAYKIGLYSRRSI